MNDPHIYDRHSQDFHEALDAQQQRSDEINAGLEIEFSECSSAHTEPNTQQGQTIRWDSWTMACGTVRHRLFMNSKETPYFIDKAKHLAHFTQGDPVGLFGSGMGKLVRRLDNSSYQIAAVLGSFRTVREAKQRAVELARNSLDDRTEPTCHWFDSLPKPPEPLPWVPQEKATDRHPFE